MARINTWILMTRSAFQARRDDEGAVAAEYGVLLAGVVVAVTVAALALGGRLGAIFDSIVP